MATVIPELDWLAVQRDPDESWLGLGPMLVNLQPWMESLADAGPQLFVATTYAAAQTACQHWENWVAKAPAFALESILDARPPIA